MVWRVVINQSITHQVAEYAKKRQKNVNLNMQHNLLTGFYSDNKGHVY